MVGIGLALVRAAAAAPELCNGYDDDGDGAVDEWPVAWFSDGDADGYGDPASMLVAPTCSLPLSFVANGDDCDDTTGAVSPDGAEGTAFDAIDNDCNGLVDDLASYPIGASGAWDDAAAYVLQDALRQWGPAGGECDLLVAGGAYHLASLGSGDQNDTLFAATSALGGTTAWWIGYRNSAGWGWSDGTPVGYENWNGGAPAGGAGKNCVILNTANAGLWDNVQCTQDHAWICEAECVAGKWFLDADGDGFGGATSESRCGGVGWVRNDLDCDDTDPYETAHVWFLDDDHDGEGDPIAAVAACDPFLDYTADNDLDCDDTDPTLTSTTEWYSDGDADGSGGGTPFAYGCGVYTGVHAGGDCDDGDYAVHPGATEVCGGADEDCDGLVDDADDTVDPVTQTPYWPDADLDGFGADGTPTLRCGPGAGLADHPGDCDDSSDAVHPGVAELCNGADDDCDGTPDDDVVDQDWYADADGDGFGDPAMHEVDCIGPTEDWVTNAEDCDDTSGAVHPGAEDVPGDGIDQDCSGGDGTATTTPGGDDDDDPTPGGYRGGSASSAEPVGCTCDGSQGGGGWLAALAALAWRRRRWR